MYLYYTRVVWCIIGFIIAVHITLSEEDLTVSVLLKLIPFSAGGPLLASLYILTWWRNQDFTYSFMDKVLIKKTKNED